VHALRASVCVDCGGAGDPLVDGVGPVPVTGQDLDGRRRGAA
jgi:hypothetical protein